MCDTGNTKINISGIFSRKTKSKTNKSTVVDRPSKACTKCKKNKVIIQNQEDEIRTLRALNRDIQREIIDKIKISTQIENHESDNKEKKKEREEKVPVGTVKESDQMIHLGRDQWLSLESYNSIVSSSKTPKKFLKNLSFAVFGHDTLKETSVTDEKCNSEQNATPKPSLDSTKLLAIKDMYHHYLMTNLHYSEEAADLELVHATSYIVSKISDKNKPSKATKGKKGKREKVMNKEMEKAVKKVVRKERKNLLKRALKFSKKDKETDEETNVDEQSSSNVKLNALLKVGASYNINNSADEDTEDTEDETDDEQTDSDSTDDESSTSSATDSDKNTEASSEDEVNESSKQTKNKACTK
ncbi:suppressor protein SRP40 isoform X1 [Solenopsis invicta]|uniref:suppressor protein SRP40 isoform X1 n=1 Tax=Solenopsis invicta TaxID=13686 RepID=UPI00193EA82E|nr:suppressor protein SRP40 isoform X1 [Solenopsis invicta]